MSIPPTPVILLLRPQMGENIGAAARAMLNFGLTELRIIAPRDGWPNQKAVETARGAKEVIENAKLYATTQEAVADLQYIYATTARMRDMVKPTVTARYAAEEMRKTPVKSGLMFGPERTGLENDDIAFCDAILTIPLSDLYPSLNLAQSIAICCYEWFQAATINPAFQDGYRDAPLASKDALEHLFSHLEQELDQANFFQVPDKKPKIMHNIRAMFQRAGLTDQEVRTLRGVITALIDKRLKG